MEKITVEHKEKSWRRNWNNNCKMFEELKDKK
jgi:hypothetical protein